MYGVTRNLLSGDPRGVIFHQNLGLLFSFRGPRIHKEYRILNGGEEDTTSTNSICLCDLFFGREKKGIYQVFYKEIKRYEKGKNYDRLKVNRLRM